MDMNFVEFAALRYHNKLAILVELVRPYRGASRCFRRGRGLHQVIVRVEMIKRRGSYQFVIDKDSWRDRLLIQNIEADANKIWTIALREERDRTD